MIIVEPRKLRFLRAGRFVTVETDHAYRTGHVCGLGVRHGRRIYQAEVVQVERISRRLGFVLTIRLAPEPERFLARNPVAQRRDYVGAGQGAQLPGAGAAVDAVTLARYARAALERDDPVRRERAANRPKSRRHRYAP